jgi:hypothetical protein
MHNSAYFNSLEEVAMEIAAIGGATSYNASGASQTTTAASGSSGSGKVYDKKDSNEDGIVSAAEEIQYAIQHPKKANQNRIEGSTSPSYTQQGKMTDKTSGAQNAFDIYA